MMTTFITKKELVASAILDHHYELFKGYSILLKTYINPGIFNRKHENNNAN